MNNKTLHADYLLKFLEEKLPSLLFYAQQWSCENADDVVQEAFLKLVRYSSEFGKPDNLPAWMFRTVRNTAISIHRTDSRRKNREEIAGKQLELKFTKPADDPLEIEEMRGALEKLPFEQREIVFLRIWGELTFDEIADAVNQPRATVHRHYKSALENLKNALS
ncbi:MAG: RNA polymerase sigma factor [Thermoguttaceae bacterium]